MKRVALIVFAISLAAAARAQEADECPNKRGWKPSEAKLQAILAAHKDWIDGIEKGGGKIRSTAVQGNLCNAYLHRADLRGAMLAQINLQGAFLSNAKLQKANLFKANLKGAQLHRANLEGANLRNAKLQKAKLSSAILWADFSGAMFEGAYFYGSDLKHALLSKAKLSGAIFQPIAGGLPAVDGIAEAKGLSELRYERPRALVDLRKLFKDAGYRGQEREVTYALKHGETVKKLQGSWGDKADGTFNYILFDLTTAWGMQPGRALQVLAAFIFVFTPAYWLALVRPGRDGIWRIWSEDRRRRDLGIDESTRPIELRGLKAWRTALYFSLLSAFHIGWRDLNVGNWIARIQRYEFTYRATGWARTVSGIQSLLSVYLLAIWALTYFGRPFE